MTVFHIGAGSRSSCCVLLHIGTVSGFYSKKRGTEILNRFKIVFQWPGQHTREPLEKARTELYSAAYHAAALTVQSCSDYCSNPPSCPLHVSWLTDNAVPHYTAQFKSIVSCSLNLEQGLHHWLCAQRS